MDAKHTPGPWSVFDDIDPNRATYGIDGPDGSAVVFFGTSLNDGIRRLDDARLIAAAPDLLEALKDCAAVCAGETMSKQGLVNALEKARAAITKATGGQP